MGRHRVGTALFSILLAVHTSYGQCQVGEITYQPGEAWDAKEGCFGYICLEDGSYNITECTADLEEFSEVWELNFHNPNSVFPWCCSTSPSTPAPFFDYSLSDCILNNETFKVGEQRDLPGLCLVSVCKGNNQWFIRACGLLGVPQGWIETREEFSKPFPQCCASAVPLLDLVPDLLDAMKWSEFLEIIYNDYIVVDPGIKLTSFQIQNQPEVNYTADLAEWYLVTMIDPDVPSRQYPMFREFQHWLVGNIPGNNVSAGEVLTEYLGSTVDKAVGLHRHVFFVFKQPAKINFNEPRLTNSSFEERKYFSVRDLVKKYNLEFPVAFNVFQIEWEEYFEN